MSIARYVGLAEETSFNQPASPAAVTHVDIASSSLDVPSDTQLIYGGGLQRSAITHRPGFYSPSGNLVYAFDIRTIGFLLKWALGGYDFTASGGTGSLNLHEFYGTAENVLPSFVARVGKDHFEHVFSGCVINSLEITVEGEWCQATADIVAAKDSRADLVEIQNLLLSPAYPLAFYEVTASIDGSPSSCSVKSFTLTINNNQDAEAGRGLGQRHPCRIIAGERETTFSKDLFFENIAALQKIWGGTDGPSSEGPTEFAVELTFDSGDHGTMVVSMPKVIYTSVAQQPSGRDEITQSTSGRALMDDVALADGSTTVTSEIYIRLENEETRYGVTVGTVTGTVTDSSTSDPIVGATVTANTGETAVTTEGGVYSIVVESGTKTLTFEADTYTTDTLAGIEVAPDATVENQDIALVLA